MSSAALLRRAVDRNDAGRRIKVQRSFE